ncbi:Bax inhibitor-1/YccA family membrane protein [Streptomyces tendae]|uniref:Bax inhibitor-1/YccA family membrane protein n=1 Tax=Streptomyces tendae TaxID=1932 RepID=UPI001E424AC5|nr:Bax inhibitor-1/YccA family protein [Streptomyces tendae]
MKSSNPVLSRRVLGRHGGWKTTAGDPDEVRQLVPPGVDEPSVQSAQSGRSVLPHQVGDLLLMGPVLARAALAFVLTAFTAVLSWLVPPVAPTDTAASYTVAAAAGLTAAVPVLIQCRTGRPSPLLTLAFAPAQGAFLGVLSNTVSTHLSPGILVQFVLGTLTAHAGVLTAYALHWVRVGSRTHGLATAAALGVNLLIAADFTLTTATTPAVLGLQHLLPGAATGLTGLLTAICFLSLHLRRVEHEITHGTPRTQAWPAALGLTLTLTWLYVETLRLLTLTTPHDLP